MLWGCILLSCMGACGTAACWQAGWGCGMSGACRCFLVAVGTGGVRGALLLPRAGPSLCLASPAGARPPTRLLSWCPSFPIPVAAAAWVTRALLTAFLGLLVLLEPGQAGGQAV